MLMAGPLHARRLVREFELRRVRAHPARPLLRYPDDVHRVYGKCKCLLINLSFRAAR